MKLAPEYEFTALQARSLRRARLLEYLSIAYLASVIALMYVVMGASQAMKTAWVEDCLSLVPPLSFLLASHVAWRPATRHYPYGFHRVVSILFLLAAVALLVTGAFLLVESALTLLRREHPSIGMQEWFGQDLWLGWWMIAVLLWGIVPPVVLGHFKVRHAEILNDKILVTDGEMNKADWMTAAAAIGGVVGIGLGWWWADAAAAAFISFDILKDGWRQTLNAITGLINRAPTSVHNDFLDLPAQAANLLRGLDWVSDAKVRMYEHGHLICGEAWVLPRDDAPVPVARLIAARQAVCALDWRLHDFVLTLGEEPDSAGT